MENWAILLIVAIVAILIYFLMRKNTIPAAPASVAVPIQSAPGVSTTTGEVLNNTPPVPPANVTATLKRAANPSTVLQHIPVAGKAVSSISKLSSNAPMKIAASVNSSISHIPVVGSALAAPLNIANKAVSKLNPFNW
jgi:hypothetical protein